MLHNIVENLNMANLQIQPAVKPSAKQIFNNGQPSHDGDRTIFEVMT
jgi:hypothetical protein